jgi:hypothetical protein
MTAKRLVTLVFLAWPGLAAAQDPGTPMSAINWLSDSLAEPPESTLGPVGDENAPDGAEISEVLVEPLDDTEGPRADAIGLVPPHATGLPADLWGASDTATLARRITEERPDMLPALQSLVKQILLAELDPPEASGPDGQQLFLARVDKLLDMGAVEEAHALLDLAGAASPEIVRRWFDAALLLGQEDAVCDAMESAPDLSPTYPARVFCLARGGDWEGAVIVMANALALDEITENEDRLLSRFLDPDLFEDRPPPEPPRPLTPLTFRLFEAIGEPIPTNGLPAAFAQADLRSNIGWKARVEAGERLARYGAVTDNQLVGLYTEREPAASGGVWSRVRVVQALDTALESNDTEALATLLPDVWAELMAAEVEVPISRVYGPALAGLEIDGEAGRVAFHMGLLSERYEMTAMTGVAETPEDRFLAGVAQGNVADLTPPSAEARAVADGFNATGIPARFADLVEGDRLGEAILRAVTLLTNGARGNYDDVADGIALLRAVGLEDAARRTALEFLILERRG